MLYRVEVNPQNIGVVLETPFSLNPTRVGVAHDPAEWGLLSRLVEISMNNNILLNSVYEAVKEQIPEIDNIIPGIWEVLFERARPKTIPVRRTDCTFFFSNKEDALAFKNTYHNMEIGVLCEVEIIKEEYSMQADMKWLDNINEYAVTAREIIEELRMYWAGELTDKPVMEILFVGKYKLIPCKS